MSISSWAEEQARYRAGVAELVLEDYVLWKFIYNPFDDPYFILFYFILSYFILFYFILFFIFDFI